MEKLELALGRRDAPGHRSGQGTTRRGTQTSDTLSFEACWLGRQIGKKALKIFVCHKKKKKKVPN